MWHMPFGIRLIIPNECQRTTHTWCDASNVCNFTGRVLLWVKVGRQKTAKGDGDGHMLQKFSLIVCGRGAKVLHTLNARAPPF